MNQTQLEANPTVTSPALRRYFPILVALFVGSGCAALIYEVVWFQLLQLVIGSSAVSLGVLLGTYMGGMCLGSLALARVVPANRHPLRVYAAIEAGIGLCGIVVLFVVPRIEGLYAATLAHGFPGILLRGVLAAICLMPPTLLMGASLPAIARWIETTPEGISWMGFFYGGNIAGAVFGCLLTGFYLLRVYDMPTATFVAAMINVGVALISYSVSKRAPYRDAQSQAEPEDPGVEEPANPPAAGDASPIYAAIALSGLCALGAEVIWTRLLALMLGATVYTFSIILAVFLVGLGLGSSAGSILARSSRRPRLALALCQMGLVAAVAWSAYIIANSLPYWPIDPTLSRSPWYNFQLDIARCLFAILPAPCLWGASFPLALAALASANRGRDLDSGALIGKTYAANTAGAILGAVGSSMLLIPWIGTQQSERVLIGLSLLSALILFASLRPALKTEQALGTKGLAYLAAGIVIAVFLISTVPAMPWVAVAYGRRMTTEPNPGRALYMGEGMNSSIVVSATPDGVRNFHVSGKIEASTEPQDMRLQRMLGDIPALIHGNPRSILVVGFGAGVTAGTFVLHPSVENITICELEPLIPPATSKYFGEENHDVLHDPRTRIHYDDARHFVLTSQDKYDIITSDPIHPWVKGTSTLYSKEYFEMVKQHLNPGGVVTQWVPLYESDPATVKSELATFFDVFPGGSVWANDINGEGYDVVLLGQAQPTRIDVDAMQRRLESPGYARVAESLRLVKFYSAVDLLGTFGGSASELAPWLAGAVVNRDLNLRLQYLAGMGLNFNNATLIYNEMLVYRDFPTGMMVGSEARMQPLRNALAARAGGSQNPF